MRAFCLLFLYAACLGQAALVPKPDMPMSCGLMSCTCKLHGRHSAHCCCNRQILSKATLARLAAEERAEPGPKLKDGCGHEREESRAFAPEILPHLVPERLLVLLPRDPSPVGLAVAFYRGFHPEPPSKVPLIPA